MYKLDNVKPTPSEKPKFKIDRHTARNTKYTKEINRLKKQIEKQKRQIEYLGKSNRYYKQQVREIKRSLEEGCKMKEMEGEAAHATL